MVIFLTIKEMNNLVIDFLTIWWASFVFRYVISSVLAWLFALIRP